LKQEGELRVHDGEVDEETCGCGAVGDHVKYGAEFGCYGFGEIKLKGVEIRLL
jgi:hypothetical protein